MDEVGGLVSECDEIIYLTIAPTGSRALSLCAALNPVNILANAGMPGVSLQFISHSCDAVGLN
jgi:hypothetical protein